MTLKCTVSAKILHYRLGHPGDEAVDHLEEASRDTCVKIIREGVCHTCHVLKTYKVVSATPNQTQRIITQTIIPLYPTH